MRPALIVLLLITLSTVASAGAIDVAYTVTGAPGAWNVDFNVTNNMSAWPMQNVYHFGVLLSGNNVVGSPGNFSQAFSPYTNFFNGGSMLFYNNTWQDVTFGAGGDLPPGSSLSGFIVGISDVAPPTQVSWFAYSTASSGDPADGYTGIEGFYNDGLSAGFEGIASPAATAGVPEPATLAVVAGSLGLLSLVRRKLSRR